MLANGPLVCMNILHMLQASLRAANYGAVSKASRCIPQYNMVWPLCSACRISPSGPQRWTGAQQELKFRSHVIDSSVTANMLLFSKLTLGWLAQNDRGLQ